MKVYSSRELARLSQRRFLDRLLSQQLQPWDNLSDSVLLPVECGYLSFVHVNDDRTFASGGPLYVGLDIGFLTTTPTICGGPTRIAHVRAS